jgi:hypothetical protein
VTDITDVQSAWLTAEDLEQIRERLPIVYVDAIPVRVDDAGRVVKSGYCFEVAQMDQLVGQLFLVEFFTVSEFAMRCCATSKKIWVG